MKKHILEQENWHHYAWVHKFGKTSLYLDGKKSNIKDNMTIDYWFCLKKGLSGIDELRISKCARKIK